jgi:predicted adenylyl cyclase CyaB
MELLNIEMKARCSGPQKIHSLLEEFNAEFKGTDHQIDTYFKVKEGRLKLRKGTIEKSLIYYQRSNTKEPKKSDINLVPFDETGEIKELLLNALDILVVVDKKRSIYFIDNVKFHIDKVKDLGNFVEIEAIDKDNSRTEEELRSQCDYYMQEFGITKDSLLARSYADLMQEKCS